MRRTLFNLAAITLVVRRKLFGLLAAGSLLLCMATLGLWVYSGRGGFGITRSQSGPDAHTIHTNWWIVDEGQFVHSSATSRFPSQVLSPKVEYRWYRLRRSRPRPKWNDGIRFLGFEVRSGTGRYGPYRHLAVPCWFVAAVLGVCPAAYARRKHVQRRRRASGACPACGYDLRATPDRCPECGHVAATAMNVPAGR